MGYMPIPNFRELAEAQKAPSSWDSQYSDYVNAIQRQMYSHCGSSAIAVSRQILPNYQGEQGLSGPSDWGWKQRIYLLAIDNIVFELGEDAAGFSDKSEKEKIKFMNDKYFKKMGVYYSEIDKKLKFTQEGLKRSHTCVLQKLRDNTFSESDLYAIQLLTFISFRGMIRSARRKMFDDEKKLYEVMQMKKLEEEIFNWKVDFENNLPQVRLCSGDKEIIEDANNYIDELNFNNAKRFERRERIYDIVYIGSGALVIITMIVSACLGHPIIAATCAISGLAELIVLKLSRIRTKLLGSYSKIEKVVI